MNFAFVAAGQEQLPVVMHLEQLLLVVSLVDMEAADQLLQRLKAQIGSHRIELQDFRRTKQLHLLKKYKNSCEMISKMN